MKSITSLRRKPLLAALVLAGAVGFGGLSLAQNTQSPQGAAPNAATTPPASTSANNPADTSKMDASSPNKSATSSPMDSKAIPPGRAETPDSAFRKLDAANKGYISKEDAKQLSGFDPAFQQADANNDGKLTQDEFKKAWSVYSGNSK